MVGTIRAGPQSLLKVLALAAPDDHEEGV